MVVARTVQSPFPPASSLDRSFALQATAEMVATMRLKAMGLAFLLQAIVATANSTGSARRGVTAATGWAICLALRRQLMIVIRLWIVQETSRNRIIQLPLSRCLRWI